MKTFLAIFKISLVFMIGIATNANAQVQGDEFDFNNGGATAIIDSSAGEFLAVEYQGSPLAEWAGGPENYQAETAYVGRGCTQDGTFFFGPDDPYLADPAGKIAIIDRGACLFSAKINRAAAAGAIGVIIVNAPGLTAPSGPGDWRVPIGGGVISIPAVAVGYNAGQALISAGGIVKVEDSSFRLLAEAVASVPAPFPTLLPKQVVLDAIAEAEDAVTGKGRKDYDSAIAIIDDIQNLVVFEFLNPGSIDPFYAQSLFDTTGIMSQALSSVPPDFDD